MNQARINLFAQLTEDAKMALTAQDFTVSEIKEIINETPLSVVEREIAYCRYVDCMTFEEIADRMNYGVTTVKRHLPRISIKLKTTCTRLFLKD